MKHFPCFPILFLLNETLYHHVVRPLGVLYKHSRQVRSADLLNFLQIVRLQSLKQDKLVEHPSLAKRLHKQCALLWVNVYYCLPHQMISFHI